MNRAKKRRQSDRLTVSLFPFLAVLICTMGILIVLLVISVQSASVESDARDQASRNQQQQRLAEVKERGELLELEAQNVESVRADVSQRLAIAKTDRGYLQQQIEQLESEAREVYLRYRALQDHDAGLAGEETVSEDELKRLTEDVARVKKQIAQRRDQMPEVATAVNYQIVPYTGAGGTKRRPIFIECDADGLLLQPIGIRLGKTDFVDPNLIGNVLDSALLAIRAYHQKHGLTDDQNKSYPLLVVRPDGAWAYSLARRAMKSWDDEFGYELVTRDAPLQFGNKDTQLEKEIRTTIETARNRQLAIVMRSRGKSSRFGTAWRESAGGAAGTSGTRGLTENYRAGTIPTRTDSDSQTRQFKTVGHIGHKESEGKSGDVGFADSMGGEAGDQQPNQQKSGVLGGGQGHASAGGAVAGASAQQSLAVSRGANWALPTQTTGARAYIRPVRVACDQNQITILSQNQVQATIPLTVNTADSIDALVSEIWKTIDAWGIAGEGAFWKPELRFSVLPGGQQRFADLQGLLDDSGLIVEVAK